MRTVKVVSLVTHLVFILSLLLVVSLTIPQVVRLPPYLSVSTVWAQGVPLKSGAGSDLMSVNANKAALVTPGVSTRASYIVTAAGLVTTAAYSLSIEAPAAQNLRIHRICTSVSNATAAVAVTVTTQRRTTASSGGTACTAEGTAASCAMSKLDPADSNYGGTARATATLGTAGAILDQYGYVVGEDGVGTADTPSLAPMCMNYGQDGTKPIIVLAGTTNGISVNVSAPGAGGLAAGAISVYLIAE